MDAAPGAALAGAELVSEGTLRGVEWVCRTRVVEAERPIVYATESVMTFARSSILKTAVAMERYVFEPQGSGTLITYETTATREFRGFPYYWPLVKISDRFFAPAATRRCVVDFFQAAERHVAPA